MVLDDFDYLFGKDNRMKVWRASQTVRFALVRHFTNSRCCIGLFTLSIKISIDFILQCGDGEFLWYPLNMFVLKYI